MGSTIEHNIPIGASHTYILYKKINNSLDMTGNALLSISKIFVALTAALSQCKGGFKDDVIQGLFQS